MKYSTKLSDALHILAFLSMGAGQRITSAKIAESVKTNPAYIRQLMAKLKSAGMITSSQGQANAELTRRPDEITVLDVYRAIEGSSNSRMSEDAGQCAVRDTQETVEVLLVSRKGGCVYLLPWVSDEKSGVERGQEIPTAYEPDWALSMVLAQCAVRLPLSLCHLQLLDRLIAELEGGCERWVAAWQDVPVLVGRLVLAMEEVKGEPGTFEATVLDQRVRYTREDGLSTVRREI